MRLALILDGERLVTAVEREEVRPELADDLPARGFGRLAGRVVRDDAALDDVCTLLNAGGSRRLAVVDEWSHLVGLLSLKRTGSGYCSDREIESRAREPAGGFGSVKVPLPDR
ncbi:MAG TPA: hypothetical protein VFL88_00260 [Gemmatimonadales bacterium]|nr:hypothetical protein [Gemmatimonadales bacterium]